MARVRQTTAGQLLVNSILPEDLRDENRTLDKAGVTELLAQVAQKHPDQYRTISHKLNRIGGMLAFRTGGLSFSLNDLQKSPIARTMQAKLKQQVYGILSDPQLSEDQKNDKIIQITAGMMKQQEKAVFDEGVAAENPLALQALSGVRGNPTNFNSLVGGDLLYKDHRDRVIPIPVTHSYSEGLRPADYWAGSYGARQGVVMLKLATADAGFWNKLIGQATHRLAVTADDREDGHDLLGLPVETDDKDSVGSLLARDVGPYTRGTPVTARMLTHLKDQGIGKILVRSPILPGPRDGGVYAADAGIREQGQRLPVG